MDIKVENTANSEWTCKLQEKLGSIQKEKPWALMGMGVAAEGQSKPYFAKEMNKRKRNHSEQGPQL
eukprot:CAMPEP_0170546038 /NCGR_PEP_ID=MMETSP0211-20121228/4417_1 /TAXON_ID=311385 /ORGANISM="Pseudokeronopsis sp., Strain OXSARD2" /LENGTH=65 /DNA_ID=CAMNT_0010850283 /DNA_START=579 /DNA_END=776 /DNA_ORIENTATION=-